jgi:hypothetical protein
VPDHDTPAARTRDLERSVAAAYTEDEHFNEFES